MEDVIGIEKKVKEDDLIGVGNRIGEERRKDEEGENGGDEEEEVVPQVPTDGADTPEIYRNAEKEYRQLDPEEEILLWGEYIEQYPNSFFTKQIKSRIQDLEVKLYEEVENEQEGEKTDCSIFPSESLTHFWDCSVGPIGLLPIQFIISSSNYPLYQDESL